VIGLAVQCEDASGRRQPVKIARLEWKTAFLFESHCWRMSSREGVQMLQNGREITTSLPPS
jgi:hypothetical protein